MVDNVITNTLLPRISQEFLTRAMHKDELTHVRVGVVDSDFVYAFNGEPLPEPTELAEPEVSDIPEPTAAAVEPSPDTGAAAAAAPTAPAPGGDPANEKKEPEPTPGE